VVNRRVQRILWTILGGLALWPLVITGIAITGAWSGWLVAIAGYVVPVFLMLWAIITYWWLVGPVLFVSAGRKFIGVVVFVAVGVMGIALYMSIVPVHNAVSLAFAAMLAMAILVTLVVAGRLTGPGRGSKMFLGIVFVAFVAITAAIPAGGFGPLVEKVKTAAAAAQTAGDFPVCAGEPQHYRFAEGAVQLVVTPQSDKCWSGSVIIPPLHTWRFDTKAPFEVLTWDGRVLPAGPNHADEWWGDISGGYYNTIADGIYRVRGGSPVTITIEEIIVG